jgi:hypothetical protein
VNPSVDVRLDSMIRAMTDFVMVELPPGGTGAEQAALVLGHLHVLRAQADLVGPFEEFELRHTVAEAETLASLATGGPLTVAAAARLGEVVASVDESDPAGIRASTEAVRAGIEGLLRAHAVDGEDHAAVHDAVLRFERILADANRSLFAAQGWESGDEELVDLPDLLRGA